MDLDTFMTTLYVLIDDWYTADIKHQMRRHVGSRLKMSDSEVLTVAIAGQWQVGVPWRSERGVVRYMQVHGRHWFPSMLGRSQFNQRVRDLWGALVRLQHIVGQALTRDDLYESVDCTELPHCSLAQAASHDRHWLNGHLGRGGNNGGWFYGEQLLMSVTASGVITGWLVGQAQIDDRWMMEAFVSTRQGYMRVVGPAVVDKRRYDHRQVATPESFGPAITVGGATGLPYLADQGFNGDRWLSHWSEEYGATVIAAPPANVEHAWNRNAKRWLSAHRQIVDTVFSRLCEVFRLKRLNAHSDWGKTTRLAATMAAYNIGIYLNRLLNREDGALATLIV
jgi:hypothetical protein